MPSGQIWIHHAWSGDMAAAASYMPKGTPVEVVGYWFPPDGKGPVGNDTMAVLAGGKNPVLAHLFLNYMLDLPNVLENISFNGYMQPINGVTPQVLVQQGILPPSLTSTVVLPSYFDTRHCSELELAPAARRRMAAGLAAGQRRRLSGAWLWPGDGARTAGANVRRTGGCGSGSPAAGSSGSSSCSSSRSTSVLAIAGGQLNPSSSPPSPVWNPLHWTGANFTAVFHDLIGPAPSSGPIFIRTVVYVAIASVLSLAHRLSGRLLRDPVRRPAQGPLPGAAHRPVLDQLHDAHAGLDRPAPDRRIRQPGPGRPPPISQPVDWLGGQSVTVILGLVYGYIPYLILVLYAGLDRIDQRLLEAGRDLGLSRWRTFVRVTLPLSRQSILTGHADHRAPDDRATTSPTRCCRGRPARP